MAKQSKIQIAPDSTGKNLRTIKVQTYIDDVLTDVQMQVVSLADEQGNIISDFADYNFQMRALNRLDLIVLALAQIVGTNLDLDFQL